jgi:Fe-S cluster assembly protein SufD
MTQVAEKLQPWLATLETRPTGGARWLQDLRDRGAAKFAALGFPTTREEEWRFTSVSPIANAEFDLASAAPALTEDQLNGFVYAGAAHRLVIVNGRFAPALSRVSGLPKGVRFGSLAAAMSEQTDTVARYFGRLADFGTRAFTALNTAFAHDGAFVVIPDGVVLEEPLQILFVSTGSTAAGSRGPALQLSHRGAGSKDPALQGAPGGAESLDSAALPATSHRVASLSSHRSARSSDRAALPATMSHPRSLIVAGDRSQSRIVETYVGFRGETYFSNAVTEIVAGENAVLDHYRVQEESREAYHIGSVHVHAARSATFSSHSFAIGGRLVRNDVFALLDGEGAECTLKGLYLADGDRLVDNHTTIDHAKPHCPSHEVYKGILGGKAKAVFNGKIIVRPDAQKTDAKQTNRALLLSDEATINTKPQLEIFADDVKCTHGAAIGQLDEDALFYLRARGLTFAEARDMLIHAFAGEILDRVQIPELRSRLEDELYSQLAKDLAEVDAA